jgi:hypothetical protein
MYETSLNLYGRLPFFKPENALRTRAQHYQSHHFCSHYWSASGGSTAVLHMKTDKFNIIADKEMYFFTITRHITSVTGTEIYKYTLFSL